MTENDSYASEPPERRIERQLLKFEQRFSVVEPSPSEITVLLDILDTNCWIIKFRGSGVVINNRDLVFSNFGDDCGTIAFRSSRDFANALSQLSSVSEIIAKHGAKITGAESAAGYFWYQLIRCKKWRNSGDYNTEMGTPTRLGMGIASAGPMGIPSMSLPPPGDQMSPKQSRVGASPQLPTAAATAATTGSAAVTATAAPLLSQVSLLELSKRNAVSTTALQNVIKPFTLRAQADSTLRIIKAGALLKKRDILAGWQSRYFVLQPGRVEYYTDESDHQSGSTRPRGVVSLTNAEVHVPKHCTVNNAEHWAITIETKPRHHTFKVASEGLGVRGKEEIEEWEKCFRQAVRLASNNPGSAEDDINSLNSSSHVNANAGNSASTPLSAGAPGFFSHSHWGVGGSGIGQGGVQGGVQGGAQGSASQSGTLTNNSSFDVISSSSHLAAPHHFRSSSASSPPSSTSISASASTSASTSSSAPMSLRDLQIDAINIGGTNSDGASPTSAGEGRAIIAGVGSQGVSVNGAGGSQGGTAAKSPSRTAHKAVSGGHSQSQSQSKQQSADASSSSPSSSSRNGNDRATENGGANGSKNNNNDDVNKQGDIVAGSQKDLKKPEEEGEERTKGFFSYILEMFQDHDYVVNLVLEVIEAVQGTLMDASPPHLLFLSAAVVSVVAGWFSLGIWGAVWTCALVVCVQFVVPTDRRSSNSSDRGRGSSGRSSGGSSGGQRPGLYPSSSSTFSTSSSSSL